MLFLVLLLLFHIHNCQEPCSSMALPGLLYEENQKEDQAIELLILLFYIYIYIYISLK